MPRYLIFNKPYGIPSQFSDRAGEFGETLRDYVPVPDVYPVGRLDRDSEGLLLLTDDGALQHRLTDPRFEHPKTYWAHVEGAPSDADLEPIRRGMAVQDYTTRPAQARLLGAEPRLWERVPPIRFRQSIPTTWIELILHEGRNRQVRRMTAALGWPTLRLVRWATGELTAAGLAPGAWRDLRPTELDRLRRMADAASRGAQARAGQPPAGK